MHNQDPGAPHEDRTDERFVAIESKLSEQEDLTESLSRTVYRQQQKIDQLEELLSALVRRMKDSAAGAGEPRDELQDERPPHY